LKTSYNLSGASVFFFATEALHFYTPLSDNEVGADSIFPFFCLILQARRAAMQSPRPYLDEILF